jgi:hypothetical protein
LRTPRMFFTWVGVRRRFGSGFFSGVSIAIYAPGFCFGTLSVAAFAYIKEGAEGTIRLCSAPNR